MSSLSLSNGNLRKNQGPAAKEEKEAAGVAYSFDSLGSACQFTPVPLHKEAPLTFSWQGAFLLSLTQPWHRAPPDSSLGLGASRFKTPFRLSHPQNTCPHCPEGTNPECFTLLNICLHSDSMRLLGLEGCLFSLFGGGGLPVPK